VNDLDAERAENIAVLLDDVMAHISAATGQMKKVIKLAEDEHSDHMQSLDNLKGALATLMLPASMKVNEWHSYTNYRKANPLKKV